MMNPAVINKWRFSVIALAAGLALGATAIAHAHGAGGHGGGAYGGGGGHGGGFTGGRGGYGSRRGGYGYGRFGFGYYGDFGFLEYGLLFDTLPLYYSTLWWAGNPYYYANDNYYQWNSALSLYETVRPPVGLTSQVATTQATDSVDIFAYPKNGQANEQQATDRSECQHWAADQTGINSLKGNGAATAAASPTKRRDFLRAQSACLEGRGYSVQ